VLCKLSELPTDKAKLFFYFYGGEPTLSREWEYLQYKLVEMFPERELYIQTQTNLSLNSDRLERFLININKLKKRKHVVDICSSYHLNKQHVDDFISKLHICKQYGSLGLCFFSTELPVREQCISEFNKLTSQFSDKIKLRFTETANLVEKNLPGYREYLDDAYLVGDDKGKSLEYRYWLREKPEWRQYFEPGWNFNVDGEVYNFSEVSGKNIHMKFKYMKCECGSKNIVIDHNLRVYHCNDDFYNKINITKLSDLDMNTYLRKDVRCLIPRAMMVWIFINIDESVCLHIDTQSPGIVPACYF